MVGLVKTVERFDTIVMLDAAGRVVAGSGGAPAGASSGLEDLLGASLDVFYPSEEAARGEPARHLAEAAVVGHVEHEGWRVRSDGSPFWADVVLTAIWGADGDLRGYGMVMHDATDRRTAQRAVHASEEHLGLLEASTRNYAVLMLDVAGRVVSWSAGAQRVKGYRPEQIIGRSFEVFYPPEEVVLGAPERHLAEAAAAGNVEHEGWRVREDGSLFWANVVITAVVDDAGKRCGYGKVTYDASRRGAEPDPALRVRADDVRLWVANVRDYAMLMLDPAGRVIGWNAGAERIKGYRAEEIIGRSFAVFYPPEELERGEPTRDLAEASAAGHVEYEGWRLRQDGTRFWADVVITAVFDDTGAVRGYGKATRDATARREAQLALRESEEHFSLLVAGVRDHAILMLDTDGCVVSWNAGAQRIEGYTADQIIGRSHAVFYPPEDVVVGAPARHLAGAVASGRLQH